MPSQYSLMGSLLWLSEKVCRKTAALSPPNFQFPMLSRPASLTVRLDPGQITEKRIIDPAIIALAKKVTVKTDDDLNKMYPDKTASRVEILLANGERLSRQVDIPKGDPRDPMEADDIARKVKFFSGNRDARRLSGLFIPL